MRIIGIIDTHKLGVAESGDIGNGPLFPALFPGKKFVIFEDGLRMPLDEYENVQREFERSHA
jgi:hypothetical protein